jgi:hypothetical protein
VYYVSKMSLDYGIVVTDCAQNLDFKPVVLTPDHLKKLARDAQSKDEKLVDAEGGFWVRRKKKKSVWFCDSEPCSVEGRLKSAGDGEVDASPTCCEDYEMSPGPTGEDPRERARQEILARVEVLPMQEAAPACVKEGKTA